MESVMNFLAENYIWFFVAAGVLLFALIGFAIDSKRKSKSEFKGESIDSKEEVKTEVPTETIDLSADVQKASAEVEKEVEKEPVEELDFGMSDSIKDVEETTSFETPTIEETPVNPELEETNNTISFGEIPSISKDEFAEANTEESNNN